MSTDSLNDALTRLAEVTGEVFTEGKNIRAQLETALSVNDAIGKDREKAGNDYRALMLVATTTAADQAAALATAVTARDKAEQRADRLTELLANLRQATGTDADAAETNLAKAARAAAVLAYGTIDDKAAWLRLRGWIAHMPSGWRSGDSGVYDLGLAVTEQARRDTAAVRHMATAGPVAAVA